MDRRAAFGIARGIGLTRREILKYAIIGASATVVAACTGSPARGFADNSFRKFVEGTWYFWQPNYSGSEPAMVTVNADGTFASEVDPGSGTWSFENGNLQIKSTDDTNFHGDWFAGATGIPEPVADSATITWQQKNDPSISVPIRWNSSEQTLEVTARDAYQGSPIQVLISRNKPSCEDTYECK